MNKSGARNPKTAQFSIRLDDKINSRLEAVADAAGANKGTMAAMAVAAGLNLLEKIYGSSLDQVVADTAMREGQNLMRQTLEDMGQAAAVQKPDDRKFKMQEQLPTRSEWTGYMSGL